MNYLSSRLINYIEAIKQDIKAIILNQVNRNRNNKRVLCRTCCLGNYCIEKLEIKDTIKLQKTRIDHFNDQFNSCKVTNILPFLKKYDTLSFFYELQLKPYNIKDYSYIIFDSFSELVDSKFILPNKKSFFTVKGDVNIEKLIKEGGSYLKQINLDNIKDIYLSVFKELWKKYHCNIYFIVCPTYLDKRDYYKSRGSLIKNAICEISKKYDYIKMIQADEKYIKCPQKDIFPYHFDDQTLEYIAYKLKQEMKNNNDL